jgi:hypothetical protein
MAASVTDRIPVFFILAPLVGIAVWLGLGKVGLVLLAIPVLAALLCNVVAAVHHAEVVALRVGEPFGGLILALAVTVIEAGLIISLMLSGDENPALMRDTLLATVMLVLPAAGCGSAAARQAVAARQASRWRIGQPSRMSLVFSASFFSASCSCSLSMASIFSFDFTIWGRRFIAS